MYIYSRKMGGRCHRQESRIVYSGLRHPWMLCRLNGARCVTNTNHRNEPPSFQHVVLGLELVILP
jgi:hypothetical protein